MKSIVWIGLHSFCIVFSLTSLVTGLRIATQSKAWLLPLTSLLPQGLVHYWHFISAIGLTVICLIFLGYKLASKQPLSKRRSIQLGYFFLFGILMTGWSLHFGVTNNHWHFYAAILVLAYALFHGSEYFIIHGFSIFKKIFISRSFSLTIPLLLIAVFTTAFSSLLQLKLLHKPLFVLSITADELVNIDGKADEPMWQDAKEAAILTVGADNFENSPTGAGTSKVWLKAMQNGQEIFFYLRWQDDSESLNHLPIKKTNGKWQVQSDGFDRFNEKTFYEDKFAILFSNTCQLAGDATAHLGHKPLKDKPQNWHHKGYHYSVDENAIRDLWHWQAVRSNSMTRAVDSYFSSPDLIRPGNRRYAAGYYKDPKGSGGVTMNWQWFQKDAITPKRLPIDLTQHYPKSTLVWFDSLPFNLSKNNVTESIPSVLMASNQHAGDSADVRAKGIWQDGFWHLEMRRDLSTSKKGDIEIKDNICMWVSAFDHSQIGHSRHNQAIQINMDSYR